MNVIKANISANLPKMEFFHVEAFPPILRQEDPAAVVLKGIMKLHSVSRRQDGSLLGLKLSCCACTVASTCDYCCSKKASSTATITQEEEETNDEDVEILVNEGNLENASDAEDSEDDEDNDDGFAPSSIVWIKIGRLWFPGKIVSPEEVSEPRVEGFMFVRRFDPFGDLNRVALKNSDTLGENRVDAQKSSKNDEINLTYGLALSEVVGNIV